MAPLSGPLCGALHGSQLTIADDCDHRDRPSRGTSTTAPSQPSSVNGRIGDYCQTATPRLTGVESELASVILQTFEKMAPFRHPVASRQICDVHEPRPVSPRNDVRPPGAMPAPRVIQDGDFRIGGRAAAGTGMHSDVAHGWTTYREPRPMNWTTRNSRAVWSLAHVQRREINVASFPLPTFINRNRLSSLNDEPKEAGHDGGNDDGCTCIQGRP